MPRSNTPEDFWSRVTVAGSDECWPWNGPLTARGYGKSHYGGREMRAHQIAFLLATGQRPPAVCHTCDHRLCCNPGHLFAGTNGVNNADRARKGRSWQPKGAGHPMSRLTEDDVRDIRGQAASGVHQAIIGERFGISYAYVSQIVCRKRWDHVP